jgi:hypothetical protein
LTAEAAQRAECNNEIDGSSGSGIAGEGARASAKCTAATQLAGRVETAQRRAADAEVALADATRAELTDTDTKVAALPQPATAPYRPDELGVIDRISRTHDRLGTPATLAVTLALMALDTLPVILKLSHGTTNYERILARRHQITATRLLAEATPAGGAAPLALLDGDHGPDVEIVDDEQLEQFLRAHLILDPHIQAKDLHALARARGYAGKYSTFTRLLRTRHLRTVAGRTGTSSP